MAEMPQVGEADVATSYRLGTDTIGRGVIVQFRMSDTRIEHLFLPSIVALNLASALGASLSAMKRITNSAARREKAALRAGQPEEPPTDWNAERAADGLECHVGHNGVILRFRLMVGAPLMVAFGPVMAAHLHQRLERDRARLLGGDGRSSGMRH